MRTLPDRRPPAPAGPQPAAPAAPLTLTFAGVLDGMRLALPVAPGLVAYALAFGAAAANRGLNLAEAMAMSGVVYAGASQMVALEMWRDVWTPAALLTVAVVTAAVNARFALMGASVQPWLRGAPKVPAAFGLYMLADANWLIVSRYAERGGRDLGVLIGSGLGMWPFWVGATALGYGAGALVSDPKRYALDLVLPIFFAVLAVPLWRGMRSSGLPWIVAALTGLATQALVPGYLFIVVGALAGALAAALTGARPESAPS